MARIEGDIHGKFSVHLTQAERGSIELSALAHDEDFRTALERVLRDGSVRIENDPTLAELSKLFSADAIQITDVRKVKKEEPMQ